MVLQATPTDPPRKDKNTVQVQSADTCTRDHHARLALVMQTIELDVKNSHSTGS